MTTPSKKRWRPFRFLAERVGRRIPVPTARFAACLAAGAAVVPVGYALNAGSALFWAYNGLLAALSALDVWMLPRRGAIRAERLMPERVDLGKPFGGEVRLFYRGALPIRAWVKDDWPLEFDAPETLAFELGGGKPASRPFAAIARQRGKYRLSWLEVRFWGGLGLWMKQVRLEAPAEMRVVPDLSGVRGVLGSLQANLILDGRRMSRRHASGTDLQTIREYVPDDDPRTINWAATARGRRLMVNVRQPERGKTVTILLDCGRVMGTLLDGRLKLDRTLEAALVLAAVALRQGDQVAALAFAGDIRAYVPPGKGTMHLQTILDAVYDLKSEADESGYERALQYLMRVQKKRSLAVLFSDMDNHLLEQRLLPYLARLRRLHAPLLLSLQDPLVREWANTAAADARTEFIRSTAQKQAMQRREYTARLAGMGIQVLDVPADQLALAAVNRYLDLKSGGRF